MDSLRAQGGGLMNCEASGATEFEREVGIRGWGSRKMDAGSFDIVF